MTPTERAAGGPVIAAAPGIFHALERLALAR